MFGGEPRRILVADDNEDIRDMLGQVFTDEGFHVLFAADGEEAVRVTAASRPHLVLLDMRMPRENGLGVLRRIRETDLDTAIVLHTAFGSERLALEALRAGADDYLRKPVELSLLLERVHASMVAKEGQNALRQRAEQRMRESEALYRATTEELSARVATIEVIQEVARSLHSNLDLAGVSRTVVSQWRRLLPYDSAAILLLEEEGTAARVLANHDTEGKPFPPAGHRFPIRSGLIDIAMLGRHPLRFADLDAMPPRELGPFEREMREHGARALMLLPVLARDAVLGVMLLMSRTPGTFTERHAALAEELLLPTSIALQNARLYRDLLDSYASLERTQGELLRSEQLAALGQLSGVMAHELRNPLAVIFNSLGPLRQLTRPEGDAALLLTIIEEESERLNRIVGSLLDFARPANLEMREGDLSPVLFDALREARDDPAHHPGITLNADYGHDETPLRFDARQVRQALGHLLQNAVQALRREGSIWLRTSEVEVSGKRYVRIAISDDGPGVPAEVRERIFEPFFTTRAKGTGLGLPIVKRVVDDHRGLLQHHSRPGEGASFAILLPR